jgi:rhodanese-related sulfurtransferase
MNEPPLAGRSVYRRGACGADPPATFPGVAGVALPATPFLVDVRTPPEFNQGRIDGPINVPLNRLRDHLGSLPAGREMVVYCANGYRSAIAASLMLVTRFRAVTDLVGGLAAWEAARLPVT